MAYLVLEVMLEELRVSNPKNRSVAFALIYINLYRKHNLFKAALIHQQLLAQKNSLQDAISLSRVGEVIEERICSFNYSNSASPTSSSLKKSSVDVRDLLDFEKDFFKFKETMVKVCKVKDSLLSEVELPKGVSKSRIESHSAYIFDKSSSLSRKFDSLSLLKPSSVPLLVGYAWFNALVLNRKTESKKAIARIQAIREDKERHERIKSSKTEEVKGIIAISLDNNDRGRIKLADQYVLNMLHYGKDELLGKNLSETLPENLVKKHDQYLKNFGSKSESQVVNQKKLRFFVDSHNFLAPIVLEVKFHLSVRSGIDLVGLVYDYKRLERYQLKSKLRYYLTYNQNTGDIGYVCKNCSHYLGF